MMDSMKVPASTWASDVRALIDAMLLLSANEILTYTAMEQLLGKTIKGDSSEYQVARERLARDYHVEIKTIPRVGAQRLDDGGIVEELPRDRDAIHRKVHRSIRRAGNIEDYGALTNAQKLEHDRHAAHLGLMAELNKPHVARAIDDRVRKEPLRIDVDKLIEALRG